jgi:SAM-dependent methyltransferase
MNSTLLKPTCDFCGKAEFRTLRSARMHGRDSAIISSSSNSSLMSELLSCLNCGLQQVERIRSSEDLLSAYESVIDETHSENSDLRVRSFQRAMKKIMKIEPNISPKDAPHLVDIGCAGGEFPYAAHKLGFKVTAFEPSAHLSKIGREKYNLDIRSGAFDKSEFEESSVDVVTLWDVLEHVDSPKKMISDVVPILRPGGYLVLNLPMIDTPSARILRFRWPFYLEVHLYYFTMKTIRNYLVEADFTVISHKPYSQTLSVDYLVRRASGGRFKKFPIKMPFRYRLGQRTIVAQLHK